MKIKINEKGNLEIERAGKFKRQLCPFTIPADPYSGYDPRYCGDWCPLFREPECDKNGVMRYLTICKREFVTLSDEIIDERVKRG